MPLRNIDREGLRHPQSLNHYSYTRNDPINAADPTGMVTYPYFYGYGGFGGGGRMCQVDGLDTPCTLVIDMIGNEFNALKIPVFSTSYGWIPQLPVVQSQSDDPSIGPNGASVTISFGGLVWGPITTQVGTAFDWLNNQQAQTSTWWLQTKVFVSALGNNFVNEFKPNGCFAQFAEELATGQSADASPPGTGPEDVIQTTGQASAASYVVAQGLSTPLRSSIYRGILDGTETAAGATTLIPLIYEEGKALGNEWNSLTSGTCR